MATLAFDFSASGTNPIVASQAGKQIVVKHYVISFNGDATLQFYSSGSGLTSLTGTLTCPLDSASASKGIFISPFASEGGGVADWLFQTNVGEALVLKLNSTTDPSNAAGYVSYDVR